MPQIIPWWPHWRYKQRLVLIYHISCVFTPLAHIRDYFCNFCEVIDASTVFDSSSNRPGGFGFVVIKDEGQVDSILSKDHYIKGVKIECKLALDKNEAKLKDDEERTRKIFVAGLPRNLKDELLQKYFSRYGPVQKAYVNKDFKSGKTRGFGFVVFADVKSFKNAISQKKHVINGKEVIVKETQTRKEMKNKRFEELSQEFDLDTIQPYLMAQNMYPTSVAELSLM